MLVSAAIFAAWLLMWRTAWRLRAPLHRLGIGPRITNYILISWRDLWSAAALLGVHFAFAFWSSRTDFWGALSEIGLRAGAPIDQLAALSVLLFLSCYAINLGFGLFRQAARIRPTVTTVNMVPDTPGETAVLMLVLAPISGVAEEIAFRGVVLWGFAAITADPISAVLSQAVLFGIIHLYQGGIGVLRTTALGVVLGMGTLNCGSLIPAMIAHALINAVVGIGRVSRPTPAVKA